MESVLYHIARDERTAEAVCREGLRCGEDGWIHLLTDRSVIHHVARRLMFYRTYAVVEVDAAGIKGRLELDRAGGITAPIDPEYLRNRE